MAAAVLRLTYFLFTITFVCALECYVCVNQATNKDKCIKTTIQCEENYDSCMSIYGEKQAMFWTPRLRRIHHISKSCSKSEDCDRQRRMLNLNLTCQRDWYRDWLCVECCQGEKCNYYVTLGVAFQQPCTILLLLCVIFSAAILQQQLR
ncbi:Hypothetical predicted protein [Octopus vulgaris]|uniref:Uncharacterized protein n=1 Tax=Octopus vulgaris TaxID=6645 RepID=A0AA36BS38_OCTVU|nr:Hypothetical predicted protein [Octopus vulgaris]